MGVRAVARGLSKWARYGRAMVTGLREHLAHRDHSLGSLPRRVAEQWRLLLQSNVDARMYYIYGLYRPDLPWARKAEFVGDMEPWRWQGALNPPQYRFFTVNKVIFKRYLAHAGVPVPRLLGVVGPAGRAETGEPLRTSEELRAWLENEQAENAVLKPVEGISGAGVLALGRRQTESLAWHRLPDGTITFEDIVAHLRAYARQPYFLIEERLSPHPALAVFSPNVLHTARVVTMLDGEVHVMAAALRIGRGDLAVDNFGKGNLAAPIDLDSGRLMQPAVSLRTGIRRYPAHPATGVPIQGRVVPDWAQVLAVATAAARAVPFNACLGWDIAITPDGPVVLEANDVWGADVIQLTHDRGLLATPLRAYLERSGAIKRIGLGLGHRAPRGRPSNAA